MTRRCPDCFRRDWAIDHRADRYTCQHCGARYTLEELMDAG